MGKGIIKSGGADGFYNVELIFERDRISETIATIDAHVESLTSVIDTMDEGTGKELLKLERNSYIKKKEYLQNNMPEDPTVSAWCADLTENITGNVGTIEVPGERGIVQIQPGYESNSIYDSTRDGQLQPSIASTPAATFYNLAMLPGWQKWKPTYRYGVISNIDTDANTCDVELDSAESSQQDLDINQELNLTGISVSYMSCDSIAFKDGDEVLVKFENQSWDGSIVVGFKNNPQPCGFSFKITRGDGESITEVSGLLTYFRVYNSNDSLIDITDPVYNTETEYWSFNLLDTLDADPDGYWIDYLCDDGVTTQYPYKYKNADKDKDGDLIDMGSYEDTIPYWSVTYSSNKPIYEYYPDFGNKDCADGIEAIADKPHFITDLFSHWTQPSFTPSDPHYYTTTNSFYKKANVKSSVTFKVIERLYASGGNISSFGFDANGVIGSFYGTKPCPEEDVLCLNYFASTRFHGDILNETYQTTDTWSMNSGSHEVEASISGQDFEIRADISEVTDGNTVHSYCWKDGDYYEKYSDVDLYRFVSSNKELSTYIAISAAYDY